MKLDLDTDETFQNQLKTIQEIISQNKANPDKKIYLFLDFDGVINVFLNPESEEYEQMLKEEVFDFANRGCVKRLSDFCLAYPIEIVIASSWRFSGVDYCRNYLLKYGLDEQVKFAGTTQAEILQRRQQDIALFLVEHPDFSGFLIVDDIPMLEFGENDIVVDPLKGFDENVDTKARLISTRILG